MVLFLWCLAIYALACMVYMVVMFIQNPDEVMDNIPLGTRYSHFMAAVVCTILVSPFAIFVSAMIVIGRLCREAIDKCRSSDEDHR